MKSYFTLFGLSARVINFTSFASMILMVTLKNNDAGEFCQLPTDAIFFSIGCLLWICLLSY